MNALYRQWLPLIMLGSIVLALLVADSIAGIYSYLAYVGYLYLGLLTVLVMPLLVTSVISATAEFANGKRVGGLLLKLLGYFAVTGLIAIVIGFGVGSIFANMLDVNKLSNTAEHTEIAADRMELGGKFASYLPINPESPETTGTLFVLAAVMLLFGVALGSFQQRSRTVIDIIRIGRDVLLKLTRYFLNFAPLGFFALVAARKLHVDSALPGNSDGTLYYCLAILAGLLIHVIIILPGIYWFTTRKSPVSFFANLGSTFLTAIGSGSAVLAFPEAYADVVEKNKVDQRASGMALPLGAAINRNGTAFMLAASIVFIAHLTGVELTLAQYLLAGVVVLMLSIAGPWFIGTEMLLLMPLALAIGLPTMASSMAVMYLAPVAWIIWRLSAAVDIGGNVIGAAFLQRQLRPVSPTVPTTRPPAPREGTAPRPSRPPYQQRRPGGDSQRPERRQSQQRKEGDRPRRPDNPRRSSEQGRPESRRFDRRSEPRGDNRRPQERVPTPTTPQRELSESKVESPAPLEPQIQERQPEPEAIIQTIREVATPVEEKETSFGQHHAEPEKTLVEKSDEEKDLEPVSYGRPRPRRGKVSPSETADSAGEPRPIESDSKVTSSENEAGEQQEIIYGRPRRKRPM